MKNKGILSFFVLISIIELVIIACMLKYIHVNEVSKEGQSDFFRTLLMDDLMPEVLGGLICVFVVFSFIAYLGKPLESLIVDENDRIDFSEVKEALQKISLSEQGEKRNLDWTRIIVDAGLLAEKIKDDDHVPEVVITSGIRGAIVLHLLSFFLKKDIQYIVGEVFKKAHHQTPGAIEIIKNKYSTDNYFLVETSSSLVFFPKKILLEEMKSKKLLIVDDLVSTGDFMYMTQQRLKSEGFSLGKIKTLAIVVSDVAVRSNKEPDYYRREIKGFDVVFPWNIDKI